MTDENKKEQTAAQAGLSQEDIRNIALEAISQKGGTADTRDIYGAVEHKMNGNQLSKSGKSTLRSFLSDLSRKGYLEPHTRYDPLKITPKGRQLLSSSVSRLAEETGFEEKILDRWKRIIERKQQAIIYGAPGTGKTYIARKLAENLSGTDGVCDVLRRYHEKKETGFQVDGLIETLKRLNHAIANKHYEIGISFFLSENLAEELEDIWQMEIEPYLEEYFYDQLEKVDEFRWGKIKQQVVHE